MTPVSLLAERALWRRREQFRYAKWRRCIQTLPADNPRRHKWYRLYQEALHHRRALDKRIARQPITQADQAGIAFIRREEGCVLHPYNDSADNATIGVGHLLHTGPVTAGDQARWRHFTQQDADLLLAHDLDRFETVVHQTFNRARLPASHARFDACCSLAFNIGTAGFARSSVARLIRAGNLTGAADAFLLWSQPPELRGRRERERTLFLTH